MSFDLTPEQFELCVRLREAMYDLVVEFPGATSRFLRAMMLSRYPESVVSGVGPDVLDILSSTGYGPDETRNSHGDICRVLHWLAKAPPDAPFREKDGDRVYYENNEANRQLLAQHIAQIKAEHLADEAANPSPPHWYRCGACFDKKRAEALAARSRSE